MTSPPYAVRVKRSAQKEIRNLDSAMRLRVLPAIRRLGTEPRPAGCRKLVGSGSRWRLRAGDFRIIYTIDDVERPVEIVAVRHRSKAYE